MPPVHTGVVHGIVKDLPCGRHTQSRCVSCCLLKGGDCALRPKPQSHRGIIRWCKGTNCRSKFTRGRQVGNVVTIELRTWVSGCCDFIKQHGACRGIQHGHCPLDAFRRMREGSNVRIIGVRYRLQGDASVAV